MSSASMSRSAAARAARSRRSRWTSGPKRNAAPEAGVMDEGYTDYPLRSAFGQRRLEAPRVRLSYSVIRGGHAWTFAGGAGRCDDGTADTYGAEPPCSPS